MTRCTLYSIREKNTKIGRWSKRRGFNRHPICPEPFSSLELTDESVARSAWPEVVHNGLLPAVLSVAGPPTARRFSFRLDAQLSELGGQSVSAFGLFLGAACLLLSAARLLLGTARLFLGAACLLSGAVRLLLSTLAISAALFY
jgi:hypothetical protein